MNPDSIGHVVKRFEVVMILTPFCLGVFANSNAGADNAAATVSNVPPIPTVSLYTPAAQDGNLFAMQMLIAIYNDPARAWRLKGGLQRGRKPLLNTGATLLQTMQRIS